MPPLLNFCSSESLSFSSQVTVAWLEQVLDGEAWIDPKSCLLYRPIHLPMNSDILKECVVTVSQYSGMERQHLLQLIELLGRIGMSLKLHILVIKVPPLMIVAFKKCPCSQTHSNAFISQSIPLHCETGLFNHSKRKLRVKLIST